MKNIQDTLLLQLHKYQKYLTIVISNMRLALLILFAIFSIFLIYNTNRLVSESPTEVATTGAPTKRPDKDVISVFNELQSQNIEVSSQFDTSRNNPF